VRHTEMLRPTEGETGWRQAPIETPVVETGSKPKRHGREKRPPPICEADEPHGESLVRKTADGRKAQEPNSRKSGSCITVHHFDA
jgi:hypothetical protein